MRPHHVLQPALAALLAACVLLLGLAAWSPDLHHELCAAHGAGSPAAHASHDHDSPVADADAAPHVCAITLFADGCILPHVNLLAPMSGMNATRVAAFTELLLARTLRGPERVCGPPARA